MDVPTKSVWGCHLLNQFDGGMNLTRVRKDTVSIIINHNMQYPKLTQYLQIYDHLISNYLIGNVFTLINYLDIF